VLDVREVTGRRRAIAASIALSLLFFVADLPSTLAEIEIGFIGDQTGAADLDKAYQVLQQGVDAINRERPDVVLHVGDLVESLQTRDQITARFNQATAILGGLVSPGYMTAGDHDVSPPNFVQNSPDHSREALFQALYAKLNPLVQKRLYYSFDVNGYHFVVLYSTETLDSDPRWGSIFYAGISDAQYEWLAADLAAHAASRGVFVLLQQPLWYMWSTWDRVHQLLARFPTKAVIAGHFHYNQVDSRQAGPRDAPDRSSRQRRYRPGRCRYRVRRAEHHGQWRVRGGPVRPGVRPAELPAQSVSRRDDLKQLGGRAQSLFTAAVALVRRGQGVHSGTGDTDHRQGNDLVQRRKPKVFGVPCEQDDSVRVQLKDTSGVWIAEPCPASRVSGRRRIWRLVDHLDSPLFCELPTNRASQEIDENGSRSRNLGRMRSRTEIARH
jgi:hypothetical protein